MKQLFRKKFAWIFALAIAALVVVPFMAFADTLQSDTLTTPGIQKTISLSATPAQSQTFPVDLFIECQTKNHMNSSTTVSYSASSVIPSNGTLSATSVTINRPIGWPTDNNNCPPGSLATLVGTSTVTIGAPSIDGDYLYTLKWSTNDADVNASQGNVTINLHVETPAPVDSTPPSISKTVSGTQGANGWYTSNVEVQWSVTDPDSTVVIDSGCGLDSFTVEATGVTSSCVAHSAGGSANDSVTLKIDKTGPLASLAVTAGTAGTNGWYTSDVTVSTSGSDSVSAPVTCTADQYQTTETAGAVFNGSCTNDAGLTTNVAPLTVKLDKTGPSASLAASGTLGNNGWYVGDVTIKTSGSDSISSPITCTADQQQTTDTVGAVFNGSCTNDAGLTTNATSLTVKRDTVAPVVSLVGGPTDGGSYYFGSVPAAPTCSASDATSGLDGACSVSGYSATVGAHTVTASAKDLAGNTNSASASYSVLAWTLKGFYQPVDMNGIVNTVKNGSTVPMKFEVFAGTTELTDVSAIKSTTYKAVSCSTAPTDDVELTATGVTSLRYDATSGQFIFNWQTPKAVGACLRATVTTQDGSSISADFKLK